jgi:hypothetical protein
MRSGFERRSDSISSVEAIRFDAEATLVRMPNPPWFEHRTE